MREIFWNASILSMLWAWGGSSYGLVPHHSHDLKSLGFTEHEIGIRTIRPELGHAGIANKTILNRFDRAMLKFDHRTEAVRLISGTRLDQIDGRWVENSSTFRQQLIESALDFIDMNQDILGVDRSQVELNPEATLIDNDVQFLKFRVLRAGLVIDDAGIDFRYKRGILVEVANLSFAEATLAHSDSSEDVSHAVIDKFQVAPKRLLRKSLRVQISAQGYELVPVSVFEVDRDGEAFHVQVSHSEKDIFEIRPTRFYLHGYQSAALYPRWYKDELVTVRPSGVRLVDGRQSLLTDETGAFETDLQALFGIDGYAGRQIEVRNRTGSLVKVKGKNQSGEWVVHYQPDADASHSDDRQLAQPMVYHHAMEMVKHAKKYINEDWLDRKLVANANLAQSCNAHWDGSTINFYSGSNRCANTGLIADVVYHEWGHGIDANTGGIQDGAFSEGIGDIMSLIMTRSNILGIGFQLNGQPVRDLEPDKKYPDDKGEVHAEGLIIAGTFWDLFKAFRDQYDEDKAVDILSQFIFKGLYTASRYTEMYNAVLVIDDNDADMTNGTPHFCLINAVFAQHGLAEEDQACKLAVLNEFKIDDQTGNGNGIIEPGETINIYATVQNPANRPIDDLIGKLRVPQIDGITVSKSDMTWNPIAPNDTATSRDHATLLIDPEVACGTQFQGTLMLTGNQTSIAVQETLTIGQEPAAKSFEVDGLPLPIEDNSTTEVKVSISGDWPSTSRVFKAHLKMDITHTYTGDLTISLVTPTGEKKQVYRGSGRGQNLTLDQDISELLKGAELDGEWTIVAEDRARRDEGTLNSAQLTFTPDHFECH